jgi:uncharacterized RDD family membrane protein YckC
MSTPPIRKSVFSGLGESFLAVLLGNIIYFSASPYLPARLQHELFRPDAGLLADFLTCAVIFGLIRYVRKRSASRDK